MINPIAPIGPREKNQGTHHAMQDAYFLFLGPIGRMGRIGPISCDRSYGSYGIDGLIGLMGFIGLILMMDQNLSGRHPLAPHQ